MLDSPLTAKERFYAYKPLACSSAIIVTKNGQNFRYHPGYYAGYHMIERPSYYTTDPEEIKVEHNLWEEPKKLEDIWSW